MAALLGCTIGQLGGLELAARSCGRIRVCHQVMDRGMGRLFRAGLAGYWRCQMQENAAMAEGSVDGEELLLWQTSVGCACHDSHNALKWAFTMLFDQNTELLKHLYVSVSVYKTCVVKCWGGLWSWFETVLVGADACDLQPKAVLDDFYSCLGASQAMVQLLAHDAQAHWCPDKKLLYCANSFLREPSSMERLSEALFECWHLDQFTTSRWTTIGTSCRQLTLAICTGWMQCFKFLSDTGVLSGFESGDSHVLSADGQSFACVIGLTSYVPDAMLAFCLSENPLAQHRHGARDAINVERVYLEHVPMSVWERLAAYFQHGPVELRHKVLLGSNICMSYLQTRVFDRLEELPWSLCHGDIQQNLRDLQAQPAPPHDNVSSKIWGLLQSGSTIQFIEEGVRLLAMASFTSQFVEKLHASMSLVRRHHPSYGERTLCARLLPNTASLGWGGAEAVPAI
eukprot:3445766-Amphidinium_carterae.1